MKRDYKLFIKDIIEAVESIEKFVSGMSFEGFVEDDKTLSAVIRKFEIIGEATRNIPDWIKEKYPRIPWKRMVGMRNRLIHGYFGIDHKLVWATIKIELPRVKPQLQKILKELENKKMKMHRIEKIKRVLAKNKEKIRTKCDVKILGVCGSYARREAGETRDIDILGELEKPIGFEFFELWDYLEELLGVKVDLLTTGAVKQKPLLWESIKEV